MFPHLQSLVCPLFHTKFAFYANVAEQLTQLYGTSLAGVICRNSDAIAAVQRHVMKRLGDSNPILNCSEIDRFSFEPWREQTYYHPFIPMASSMSAIKVFSKH